VTLPSPVEAAIVAHGRQASPAECCGLLVGRLPEPTTPAVTPHGFEVVDAIPARNAAIDAEHRFLVEPRDYFDTIRAARRRGLQVIGVYHSHPRSSATPSATDRAEGFSDFVFLIVGLAAEPPEVTAWIWRDGNFTRLPIVRSR
jgi:proteasome lid subunit RPN8/RPN11